MQRTLISSLAMVAALVSVGNGAFAHDDAALDKISGPNGGQLRMAGSYHFELVVAKDSKEAKDNPVTSISPTMAGRKSPRRAPAVRQRSWLKKRKSRCRWCRPATTS
jgi:hypothetical protein